MRAKLCISIKTGRGVIRFRLRGRKVPGLKLDSIADPPCIWACCKLTRVQWVKHPLAGAVRKSGEGVPAQVLPRHLSAVQNYEVRPKE
ncbi:hypothetical protein AVEN_106443-1 [Araneus ventricosus]|uniref:Uncharacterized protein n=1 Tax=Araneus ventricosus TaxID=182803 RepID=A0A4Y2ASI5_ARAVE|nr:hypothetical protein AVEN_106443-1 [Araneus ventricosus]